MKTCLRCPEKGPQPLSNFHSSKTAKDGYFPWCKSCRRAYLGGWRKSRPGYHRDWAKENPDKTRAARIKSTYGITIEQYNERLAAQGYRCAICGTDDPGKKHDNFSVDHDHNCCPGRRSCGACVRGLLCHGCNRALGGFQDNPVMLQNALDYLTCR